MIGAMLHYLANADPHNFSPINAMIGILPELPQDAIGAIDIKALKKSGAKCMKAAKRNALREIALTELQKIIFF
jgi:folate-dependent tRNA-U54 methylase TrmFO/GidA